MNNFFFYAGLITLSLYCNQLLSETITASEFNQLYSCENPFMPNESSTIILDEDIVLNDTVGGCELIAPGPMFNTMTDVVTITSTVTNAFIVPQSNLWIVALNITFNGNAQLHMFPDAMLALRDNNPTLRMSGNSQFIPMP